MTVAAMDTALGGRRVASYATASLWDERLQSRTVRGPMITRLGSGAARLVMVSPR